MKEDLKTLSENITELVNNFVLDVTCKAVSPNESVVASLIQAAPASMNESYVEKYLNLILEEIRQRPEIKAIHLPHTVSEAGRIQHLAGKLGVVVQCQSDYCIGGGKGAAPKLSMSRMSEIGAKAVDYVREESLDYAQDMTERLGLSIEELYLLEPELDPEQYIKYILEERDDTTGELFTHTFDTIETALARWSNTENNPMCIYAETQFGEIPIVRQSWDGSEDITVPLDVALSQTDLEDLPQALVQHLSSAIAVTSQIFPLEIGLPGRLDQHNAIGQMMYLTESTFYGELLNLQLAKCTGYNKKDDTMRFVGRKQDYLGSQSPRQSIVKREDVILTEEEALSKATSELAWLNRSARYSKIVVTQDTESGNIIVEPLERSEDPWTGKVTLRHWHTEFPIDAAERGQGTSIINGKKISYIFDISDLASAISLTTSLMAPHIHMPERSRGKPPLGIMLKNAQQRSIGQEADSMFQTEKSRQRQ